ncbi:MAG: DUF3592 domain-containing protein [Isosphaeraceae bacterium]
MRYLLGLMAFGFSVCGLFTLLAGLRGLWTTWRRRGYLWTVVGEVVRVEGKTLDDFDTPTPDDVYFPVLRFTTASGETRTFRSEVGTGPAPPYQVGAKVTVLYDPDDALPPMIDSWGTVWGTNVGLCLMGSVFLGLVALLAYAVLVLRVFPNL